MDCVDEFWEGLAINLLFATLAVAFKDMPFYSLNVGFLFLLISGIITIMETFKAVHDKKIVRLLNILITTVAASLIIS